ncbi:MAG: hypothetical protein ACHP84_09610 [Caulobacterales bacterium]
MKITAAAMLAATLALSATSVQSSPVSPWQAQAVKEQIQAQETHIAQALGAGGIDAAQANHLRSELAAVSLAERKAEHDGGIEERDYHKLDRQLSKLTAELLKMERTGPHAVPAH